VAEDVVKRSTFAISSPNEFLEVIVNKKSLIWIRVEPDHVVRLEYFCTSSLADDRGSILCIYTVCIMDCEAYNHGGQWYA